MFYLFILFLYVGDEWEKGSLESLIFDIVLKHCCFDIAQLNDFSNIVEHQFPRL